MISESNEAVALRWRATIEAGVDFIASDQYQDLGGIPKPLRETAKGGR